MMVPCRAEKCEVKGRWRALIHPRPGQTCRMHVAQMTQEGLAPQNLLGQTLRTARRFALARFGALHIRHHGFSTGTGDEGVGVDISPPTLRPISIQLQLLSG